MAALTPVESVEALLSAIEKSNLLSAEGLAKARETAAPLNDPKAAARALIKDGTLTRWQADQLLHNYHRLIVGKYKLLDQLETSPTGRVYLAEHVQMGRRHALKVLAKRLATNPEAVALFLKGAQNACGLDHKNISHVYDVSQDRLGHFVVMEFVEGQSLEQIVEKSGPLKAPQALEYISQIADGLVYAHSHGVVHGDLKPANVVRDNNGVIKILEIGQDGAGARPETDDADEEVETASLAAVIFQAPELRGDGEGADIACDIYSLGSLLAFLLTGKAAKNAATAVANLEANQATPADVVTLCRDLMADRPTDRPRSIDSVLQSIQSIVIPPAKVSDRTAAEEAAEAGKSKREKRQPVEERKEERKTEAAVVAGGNEGMPIIAIAGKIPPVVPPPSTDFSIQTRGRLKAKLALGSGGSAVAGPWSLSALTTRFPPLVIAGAIGGAAVFALCVATLVVLLVAANRSTKPIAKASDEKAHAAQQAVAAAAAGEVEANPAVVDVNPEVVVPVAVTAADEKAAAPPVEANAPPPAATAQTTPQPPATTPAADVAAVTVPSTQPPTTAAPAPAKPAPEAQSTSSEAPAAVVAAAPTKPPAAASTPAKKSASNPFKGFAKAISLPPLPDPDSPVAPSLKPVSLGPCEAETDAPITLNLLGGDTAIRAGRQKFELQPRDANPREWQFQLTGTSEPATIAVLAVRDNELQFQWTEEGAKQSVVARNLMNCALALGKSKQTVALRTAIKGQPLMIDIDKPSATVKWNVPNLPNQKQIFLEVTNTDGFKKQKQDPRGPTSVGEAVTIFAGPSDKSTPLSFKLTANSAAATIDVRSQTAVKIEGWNSVRPYRRQELTALESQQKLDLTKVRSDLRKAKDSRPRTDEEKEAREATIKALAKDETTMLNVQEQVRYVLDFSKETEGAAKVHFRVYCLAGDAKIELLKTEDDDDAK